MLYSALELPKQQDPPIDDGSITLCLPTAPVTELLQLPESSLVASNVGYTCSRDAHGTNNSVNWTSGLNSVPVSSSAVAMATSSSDSTSDEQTATAAAAGAVNNAAAAAVGIVCMLDMIRRGVSLRRTVPDDRSAPKLDRNYS